MTDIKNFRACLGQFASGVTIVTCTDAAGHPYGVTANSFSSVSLEPPLVLWNIAKVTNSLQAYLGAGHFAINILASNQRSLSNHFAKSEHHIFKDIEYLRNDENVPLLPDVLAQLECRTDAIHDCGDHYIIVGEVLRFSASARDPLLFYGGGYRSIAVDGEA
jgi:flavin reductase (DIM6/NTAB) family NADH-FMN oxidoreductase RutF